VLGDVEETVYLVEENEDDEDDEREEVAMKTNRSEMLFVRGVSSISHESPLPLGSLPACGFTIQGCIS